mmetsp:Transcript_50248/g.95980  ORF Transcript_50248/g.95980 Transcript_50248/m.95980 type:complete len:92 (-) Transcript_50248:1836-2111(-)
MLGSCSAYVFDDPCYCVASSALAALGSSIHTLSQYFIGYFLFKLDKVPMSLVHNMPSLPAVQCIYTEFTRDSGIAGGGCSLSFEYGSWFES